MKIICEICSNKFNPERTGGICPQCGNRVSDSVVAEAKANEKVKGETVTQVLKSYLNEQLKKQDKKSPLRKKSVQLVICGILISLICAVAAYSYAQYTETLKNRSNFESTVSMQTESHAMSDVIEFKGTPVKIISCTRADYDEKILSEGFKLIEICYDRGEFIDDLVLSDVYLNDGEAYVTPLDTYELEKVFDKSSDQLQDLGYCDYFRAQTEDKASVGKLIFAVREDITEFTLCAYKMNETDDGKIQAELRYDIAVKEEKSE